jgi:uncharacterized membrane protein (DUF4010 family)
MIVDPLFAKLLLALGLGLFFGLAFEEFQAKGGSAPPGGIRTFPMLAITGALLYQLDPGRLLPLCVGLAVLGLLLAIYYRQHTLDRDAEGRPNTGMVVVVCNLLAFLIGPVALAQPGWVAVGASVAAVLLLTAREQLHSLARKVELGEIVTAGKFLLLTGLVMPLLPDQPVTGFTDITPHQVWLAVLAVCSMSYASYLLQRYVAPEGGLLGTAVLGGLYSSTATTVVLARRAAAEPGSLSRAQGGIVLATAIMYLRLLVIIAVFNRPLALVLALPLAGLSALGGVAGLLLYRRGGKAAGPRAARKLDNPLELTAALTFALLFVAVSLLTSWMRSAYGAGGIDLLAAIVGVADVDPFVLSIAEGGSSPLPVPAAAVAILIAASSNNLLKAGYTIGFAGLRASLVPVGALVVLAFCGGAVAAAMLARGV